MSQAIAVSRGRYYLAIFVLACAALAYQILITRFFSVVLYYHFAFAAISLAMLGLTRGAIEVFNHPARYAPEKVAGALAHHATWFGLTSVGAMVGFLCAPLVIPERFLAATMPVATLAFVVPFTQSGICISLLLTRLPFGGGRMYAADLSGAAVGCLAVILALLVVDPVSATLWIGAFAVAVAWLVARDGSDVGMRRFAGAVAVVLAMAAMAQTGLAQSGRSALGVFWAKGEAQKGTLFERWNTYSRIRVTARGAVPPLGGSYARVPRTPIDQDYLDIDADASTVITRFDGDFDKVAYLKDDVINAAYVIQRPDDVAVVGVGGGRDILSARLFGARRITGIEINPAIFAVLTDRFADFSGHLDQMPGVSLVNAEARSYLNRSSERYDLVQISLIDTWAATAAGGLTLTENRLYTVEAWRDFYRALKPGGMLSVSRWYAPLDYPDELYRLVAIAATALENIGVPANELSRHVVVLNVDKIVTVVTRPEAFSDAEWKTARAALQGAGFNILLGPDIPFDGVTSTLLSGIADAAFYDALPQNVTPSTDNKPFFFYTARWSDFFRPPAAEAGAGIVSDHNPLRVGARRIADLVTNVKMVKVKNNSAVLTMFILIVATLCAGVYYVGIPFVALARRMPLSVLTPPAAYFSAIGMGFMLVEISQMQRLMVFLGHPVYGLGVVLFTLLLFSGLGSATVGRSPPRAGGVAGRTIALIAVLAAVGVATPAVMEWGRTASTEVRILVSALLLAPQGFFMGMMFPLGLGAWRERPELLPFFWSANGITSVLASVLGMAFSMEFGLSENYAIGVGFYLVSAVLIVAACRARRKQPEPAGTLLVPSAPAAGVFER